MKAQLKARFWGAAAVIATLLAFCGAAQDGQISTPDTEAKKLETDNSGSTTLRASGVQPSGRSQPATSQPRTAVEDILRMTDAGVSKEVIKAYVENMRRAFAPTATDLIALKQHSVPDDITTALLKRSGEIQTQKAQPSPSRAIPTNSGYGLPDPESYSYFQRYYLYPRTLAFTYGRLGGYYPQAFPRSYYSFNPAFAPGY
jgi:hypothetical protein